MKLKKTVSKFINIIFYCEKKRKNFMINLLKKRKTKFNFFDKHISIDLNLKQKENL